MNPLWSKAPFLLLRFPKAFAAIAGSALILGIAGVSSSLFLESSTNAALDDQIEETTAYASGLFVRTYGSFDDPGAEAVLDRRTSVLETVVGDLDHLQPVVVTMLGSNAQIRAPDRGGHLANVKLISRSRAQEHLEIVDGDGSGGVLISDEAAQDLGNARAGDEIVLAGTNLTTRIGGIYRAIYTQPNDGYWGLLAEFIYPNFQGDIPPSFLIADQETFFAITNELHTPGEYRWEYAIETPVVMSEARELNGVFREINDVLRRRAAGPDSFGVELLEAFDLSQERLGILRGAIRSASFTSLPDVLRDATATATALKAPVFVLSLAGRLVALLVMAAAGAYLLGARRVESTLLAARGVAPAQIGLRATIESLLPALVGAAIGAAGAVYLIRLIGPSDLISSTALRNALIEAGVTLALGLMILGLAVGIASRRLLDVHQAHRSIWSRFPWEAVVLLLAGAAYYEIDNRGTIAVETSKGNEIDVFVLLFPVLFLLGAAGLAGRVLRVALPRLRRLGSGWRSPAYLANRRLAGAPGFVIGLVTASVLAVSILVYAHSVASTVEASTGAKAGIFIGSDVAVSVFPGNDLPPDLPIAATKVRRVEPLATTTGAQFGMLGIDRESFERAAFWDPALSDRSLDELLALLDPSSTPLPVIVASGDQIGDQPLVNLAVDVPLQVIARVDAFPGMAAGRALVIADVEGMRRTLAAGGSAASTAAEEQVWAKGDPDAVAAALQEAGINGFNLVSTEVVLDKPILASLTWTLELFRALGIAAGAIVLMALMLYMQVRQRTNVVSYALARRMNLSRGDYVMSLALELWAMLLVAVAIGTAGAWGVARLIYTKLDLLPDIPPAPFLRMPMLAIAATALAGLVASVIGAVLVQRGADRANVAEVLRVAG